MKHHLNLMLHFVFFLSKLMHRKWAYPTSKIIPLLGEEESENEFSTE